jgi:two-component system cell cycle sensor histidine kinase/response regulator CckA
MTIRILMVEDSEDDCLLILSRLRADGLDFVHEWVATVEETVVALAERPPDVVLSDYSLPTFSAEAALEVVRAAGLDVPFILVSGKVGEDTAAGLMLAGANDFVLKDRLARLAPAMLRELRDADERRQLRLADAALRASEERFRLLAEHAQDVIFRYRPDPDPAVEYISPAVRLITGRPPADFYADPELLFSLVHPEDRAALRASWQSVEPASLTVRWRGPHGSTVWTEQRAAGVRDSAGVMVAVEGALRDVTEHTLDAQRRDQLEEQLRQAERMESVGQLAGGIAHDFNNLLATIIGYADLMGPALPADSGAQADLTGIRTAADRGAGLIRQLLVFSHPATGTADVVDINTIVADTELLLRRTIGGNIEFVVQCAPGLWPVTIERSKLEQSLVNLIINARAAMPDGGTIAIRTANVDGPPTGSAAATPPPGRNVRLTVTDTGTGMDAEVARRAFEPFFTTKGPKDGTGLGLATVYGAVTEAGGQIRLASTLGEGTTFDLYLPATDQLEVAAPPDGPPRPARTILVVDDEDALRGVISRILRAAGYQVLDAANPAEALELYGGDSTVLVDAVLTDYLMPGMSGDDLIDLLQIARPGLPALLMSAYTPDRRLGRQPAPAFLAKPFTTPLLLRRLQEVLDR